MDPNFEGIGLHPIFVTKHVTITSWSLLGPGVEVGLTLNFMCCHKVQQVIGVGLFCFCCHK
jgi:hypothetical protein